MASLVKLRGAIVEHVDPAQRWLIVGVPPRAPGNVRSLTLKGDDGALVATKDHRLMKLDGFQIGQRVSVIYSQLSSHVSIISSSRGVLKLAALKIRQKVLVHYVTESGDRRIANTIAVMEPAAKPRTGFPGVQVAR